MSIANVITEMNLDNGQLFGGFDDGLIIEGRMACFRTINTGTTDGPRLLSTWIHELYRTANRCRKEH